MHTFNNIIHLAINVSISETDNATTEKLADVLDDTFIDYVHSDVPLGSFLSGGVDSPVVNAVLEKI